MPVTMPASSATHPALDCWDTFAQQLAQLDSQPQPDPRHLAVYSPRPVNAVFGVPGASTQGNSDWEDLIRSLRI